jgi:hypothetical protein
LDDYQLGFDYLTKVEMLNLTGNNCTIIGAHLFTGMTSLKELYMAKNGKGQNVTVDKSILDMDLWYLSLCGMPIVNMNVTDCERKNYPTTTTSTTSTTKTVASLTATTTTSTAERTTTIITAGLISGRSANTISSTDFSRSLVQIILLACVGFVLLVAFSIVAISKFNSKPKTFKNFKFENLPRL